MTQVEITRRIALARAHIVRMKPPSRLRRRLVPEHDIILERQIGRQVKATAEPQISPALKKRTFRGWWDVGIARMRDDRQSRAEKLRPARCGLPQCGRWHCEPAIPEGDTGTPKPRHFQNAGQAAARQGDLRSHPQRHRATSHASSRNARRPALEGGQIRLERAKPDRARGRDSIADPTPHRQRGQPRKRQIKLHPAAIDSAGRSRLKA